MDKLGYIILGGAIAWFLLKRKRGCGCSGSAPSAGTSVMTGPPTSGLDAGSAPAVSLTSASSAAGSTLDLSGSSSGCGGAIGGCGGSTITYPAPQANQVLFAGGSVL